MREDEDPDRPPKHLWRSEEEEEGEDPLVALGHMVKLASIGIWRKVASKGGRTRPDMQERSNSDPMLEVTRPVTYADDEDASRVLVDEPTEDTSDDKPSLPQSEIPTKTVGVEAVAVQTQVMPTVPISMEEE